jgi:hypothetical protein
MDDDLLRELFQMDNDRLLRIVQVHQEKSPLPWDWRHPPPIAPSAFKFHERAKGRRCTLSENRMVATRRGSFSESVIMGDRPLCRKTIGDHEIALFEFEIVSTVSGWSGSVDVGLTVKSTDEFKVPDSLNNDRPYTLFCSINPDPEPGMKITIVYNFTTASMWRYINGQLVDISDWQAYHWFNTKCRDKLIWPIIDVYGKTTAVKLTIHPDTIGLVPIIVDKIIKAYRDKHLTMDELKALPPILYDRIIH